MNPTTTTASLFSSTPTQSPSKPFPGKKLLLSDNRRIKLLKNNPIQRIKQKVKIQLIPSFKSPHQPNPHYLLQSFCNQIIKSQDLNTMLKRQNHDSMVKKRVEDISSLRRMKTDRKEKLLSKLKIDYESERDLDRAVSALRGKKDKEEIRVDRIKYQNLHNPFFKSFKSRAYVKSKQRIKKENEGEGSRETERYGEGDGWNSSRSLASYFGDLENRKGGGDQNSSRFSTLRMKSMYQGR